VNSYSQSSQGNSNKAQKANLHMEIEKQYRCINNNNDTVEQLIKSYAPYGYVYSQQSTVIEKYPIPDAVWLW